MPFITETEVLDCPICYEPLNPPVFQCKMGYIACSSCCFKLNHKCPSCCSSCRYCSTAVEKILESVKVTCQIAKYGCEQIMTYNKKHEHKRTCIHSPCSYPHPDCNFVGLSSQLYQHYSDKHKHSAVQFQYNRLIHVIINVDGKCLVLQEEKDGVLFIVHNGTEPLGNVLSVSCITNRLNFWHYNNVARKGNSTATLKFQSLIQCFCERPDYSPSLFGFLMVPSNFIGSDRQLKLDIRIWGHRVPPDEHQKN